MWEMLNSISFFTLNDDQDDATRTTDKWAMRTNLDQPGIVLVLWDYAKLEGTVVSSASQQESLICFVRLSMSFLWDWSVHLRYVHLSKLSGKSQSSSNLSNTCLYSFISGIVAECQLGLFLFSLLLCYSSQVKFVLQITNVSLTVLKCQP